MAVDNVLGSVSIVITGDTSRLQGDFARAQALAIASGAEVSAAFNQSAAGADRVVLAIGKLAGIIQQESSAASLAAQRNLALAVSHAQLEASGNRAATAIRRIGDEGPHSVTQIQAVSGAIRTFDGNQGIRAAERFLTLIPGIGAALQVAFPLVGAIALFEIIGSAIKKFNELTEAEKHLAEATKENNAEFDRLGAKFESINVERITAEFGRLKGLQLKGFYDQAAADHDRVELANTARQIEAGRKRLADTKALYSSDPLTNTLQAFNPLIVGERLGQENQKDQIAKLKELQGTYDVLTDKLRVYDNQKQLDDDLSRRTAATQAGDISGAGVANREKALTSDTEARKRNLDFRLTAAHAARQIEIDSISDVDTRSLRSAEEAVRAARAKEEGIVAIENAALPQRIALINAAGAAAASGKDVPTQAKIAVETEGKRDEAGKESQARLDAAYQTRVAAEQGLANTIATLVRKQANDYSAVWDDAFSNIRSAAKETGDAVAKAAEANAVGRVRVIETSEKSTAQTDELAIIQQKLRLEQQYSLQVVHTGAQQVAYATQIEAIEARARAAKIAGLNAELQTAIANSKDVEADEKVATIREQIAKLQGESDNAAIAAQTRLLDLIQRQTLEYKLRRAFVRAAEAVPGAVAGGLARGIVDGRGIGRDIKEELRGIGQQLLGSVFQSLIVKIGEEILAHTILGAVFQALAPPQTAAVLGNTAALLTLNATMVADKATSAAGGIAGAAGGAAGAAGSAASAASTAAGGLVGPLIAAAGGVIGGVISAFATWVGDNKIVKAVNGTTAAVLSLKGNPVANNQQPASNQPTLAPPAQGASQGGIFGFFASIFGFGGGGAKPVDVNVVAFSPISPLKGLFNLFGFAEGGRPPVGKPSIIGEKGKELWIPDEAGTIVPAGKFNLNAATALPGFNLTVPMPGLPPASKQTNPLIQPMPGGSTGGTTIHLNNAQFHGVQNVRQLMKEIATYAKTQSPSHSPYASK